MEQRPLRLGDLVDDYCPRERRVTNHAIVAIVDDGIRQTRCTTCDTEHVFKAGRLPRRRLKDEPEVAAETNGHVEPDAQPPLEADPADGAAQLSAESASDPETEQPPQEPGNSWAANRTLIRATLPRVEGEQPPPRPIPEFTIYQRNNGRHAGGFRRGGGGGAGGGGGWSGRNGQEPNGNRPGGNERRGGQGGGFGTGQGQGQGRRRHGKRRPPR